MENVYENAVKERINAAAGQDIYFDVEKILKLPDNVSSEIVMILLSYGCEAQNELPITISRECLKQFPADWITEKIMRLVFKSINLYDEWEYRRFLEIAELISDDLLEWVISIAHYSKDPEIIEAASDFTERLNKQ